MQKALLPISLCFVSFLGFMGGTIYVPALPEFSSIFHVSDAIIKYTLTVFAFGFLIGVFVAAPLTRRKDPKLVMIGGLLLCAVGYFICGLSENITHFIIGRFISGLGIGGVPALAAAFAADEFDEKEYKLVMTYMLVFVSIGPGISPLLGSILFQYFPWQVLFFTLTIFQLIAAGLFSVVHLKEKVIQKKASEIIGEYVFILKHPTLKYYCLMIGILFGSFYAFFIISSYIFRLLYGWSVLDFIWIGLAFSVANSAGAFLNKFLIDRISGHKMFSFSMSGIVVVILAFYFMGFPQNGAWILLIGSFYLLIQNLIESFLTTIALKISPEHTQIISSFIFFIKAGAVVLIFVFIPFLPETLYIVNLVLLITFVICLLIYLKVWKSIN